MLLIAIVVSYCIADLLHIQGLHLGILFVQPATSIAQMMVNMLPRIPEFTSNRHLQEHLASAALHFTLTIDKQPGNNRGRKLHSTVKAVIPMLPLWASPESPPEIYSKIGLPPLDPKLMQAKVLALIMRVVEVHPLVQSSPARESCVEWFQSRAALESCVEWFVNTTQQCMAAAHAPICPDNRWLTCNSFMAPYLKLISAIQLLLLVQHVCQQHQLCLLTCTAGTASGLPSKSSKKVIMLSGL